jgi:hypothetical protein
MTASDLLKDYQPEAEFAEEVHVSQRTVARHRNKPNGLPYMEWAGRIWIHVPGAKQYFASLTRRRNPQRGAA